MDQSKISETSYPRLATSPIVIEKLLLKNLD